MTMEFVCFCLSFLYLPVFYGELFGENMMGQTDRQLLAVLYVCQGFWGAAVL
jgi:hypothetical protein